MKKKNVLYDIVALESKLTKLEVSLERLHRIKNSSLSF